MNFSALQHAIRSGDTSEVLRLVLAGGLAAIVAGTSEMRAVRHPLGFFCLPMHRGKTDGVCVHVWSDEIKPDLDTSNVHCHSWDLLSHVLYGTVHNQRYELVATDDGPWRLFDASTVDGTDRLLATGDLVDAKLHEREAYTAGERYELAAGEFHSSELPAMDTATVVLGVHSPGVRNLVLGDPQGPDEYAQRRRAMCARDETLDLVLDLLNRIDHDVLA